MISDLEAEAKIQELPSKNLDLLPTYLRTLTFLAKVESRLGYNADAQKLCNEVIHIVSLFYSEEPKKFLLEAVRAAEISAELMCTIKEYETAFKLVNLIAEKVVKKIMDHFGVEQNDDPHKEGNCFYAFKVRKVRATVHLNFQSYHVAES